MVNLDFSVPDCQHLCTTVFVELLWWNKVCFTVTALKFTFFPSVFEIPLICEWRIPFMKCWEVLARTLTCRRSWSFLISSFVFCLNPECITLGLILLYYVSHFIFSILSSKGFWTLWHSNNIWIAREGELFILRDILISIFNLVNSTCTAK